MKHLVFLFLIIGIFGCDVIYTEDISDENIELNYPEDNATITANRIEFSWEEMAGVDSFRFQIISPSFKSSEPLFKDEIINKTFLELVLPAGEYEWRVCGLNEAYRSKYSVRTLFINDYK